MTKASASFIKRELYNLNDLEVARIVALGASEAEVVEASVWIEGDDQAARSLTKPSNTTVETIVSIAQRARDAEEDPDPLLG